MKKKISITIENSILKDIDNIVDNIYIRNRSQAIEHLVTSSLGANRTAVILSGGPENFLKIESDFRPTVKIKSKFLVEMAIEKLRESGFKTIYIVARQNILTKIFNIIKNGSTYGVKINYIEEKKSNGSADSLRLVKGEISTEFLVLYSDLIFDKINIEGLWEDHIKQNSIATILMTTSAHPSEKGTLKVEGNKVLDFTQKAKESDIYLVFCPIFMANQEIFDYPGASLERDIFPAMSKKRLLNGHLSSEREIHIHSRQDVKNFSS